MIRTFKKIFSKARGFTLIELLIVVSIITILSSIAVPNFLDAQVRSKVARTKADMRSMATAIESYYVDNSTYPFRRNTLATQTVMPEIPEMTNRLQQMSILTTPVSYFNYLPRDVFEKKLLPPNQIIDYYDKTQVSWLINSRKLVGQSQLFLPEQVGYLLVSVGPDEYLGPFSDVYSMTVTPFELQGTIFWPYDPSNGTVTPGNIYDGSEGLDDSGPKFMERAYRR